MLRQLIADGLIAPGDVDERSIEDVHPTDLIGYDQCHFFAGIGGWSVALRLALWPDNRPVWTGSCPCQPFSAAGKQKGKADERHLWPVWFRLIRESRPSIVYGEQVSSAIRHGWWDDVADDMEGIGYATRAEVRPACSVGAPHKRDRLWFMANATDTGLQERRCGAVHEPRPEQEPERYGAMGDVADTVSARPQGYGRYEQQHGAQRRQDQDGYIGETNLQWITCPDGKQRPVKSGLRLLAYGVQHRAPILHGFGNSIVPKVAAAFIESTDKKGR